MWLRRVRWGRVALAAVVLAGLYCIPLARVESGPVVCVSRRLFGVECWGCGLTRAFFRLLHGDWRGAWEVNRLCGVVFPLLGCWLVPWFVRKR